MPEDVRQAKRIKYKIGKRAELCDGTEEFRLEDGFQPDSDNHTLQSTVAVAGDRQCTPRTQSTVQPSTLDSTTTAAPAAHVIVVLFHHPMAVPSLHLKELTHLQGLLCISLSS